MRVKTLIGISGIVAALSALGPPTATAERGEFDRDFGRGGWVTTPAGFRKPWSQAHVEIAGAPGGEIVAASGTRLLRYLDDGQLDPGFGNSGTMHVKLQPGLRFSVGDLAVDHEGRIVVVGTTVDASTGQSHRSRPSATVVRYLPDGRLDPAFGNGGVVITGFGTRAATATLGAIDDHGRIVLAGVTEQPPSECGNPAHAGNQEGFVARLTADGAPDHAFGYGGFQPIPSLESVASMALDQTGGTVLAGAPRSDCHGGSHLELIRLRENGLRKRSFGKQGIRILTGSVAAIALDDRDRIVVLCRSKQLPPPRRDESATKVARLLPNGRLDPSFSGGWVIYFFQGPRYRWSALALDQNRRPLLVGTLIRRLPREDGPLFHRWLMVVPLQESGGLIDQFSWRGWLVISRLSRGSDATASDALIDSEGRLLIGGTALEPQLSPSSRIALARLELEAEILP